MQRKSRAERSQQIFDQAPVTFSDVAVSFSEEEWELLHQWQKELYQNVIKEIHEALISLGYTIVNRGIVFRIRREKDQHAWDQLECDGGKSIVGPTTSYPELNPAILLRIKEENPRDNNHYESVEKAINSSPHPDDHTQVSERSLSMKEEDGTYCLDHPEAEGGGCSQFSITEAESVGLQRRTTSKARNCMCEPRDCCKCEKSSPLRDSECTLSDSEKGSRKQTHNTTHKDTPIAERLHMPTEFQKHVSPKTSIACEEGIKRRYRCTECGKGFRKSSNLLRHRRTHTGEKPYKCDRCEKSFSYNSSLMQHMRIHTGERPYKCTECEKDFRIKSTLSKHQRQHTGEKPYKCSECDHIFRQHSHLVSHMKSHREERAYTCTQCGKSFKFSSGLAYHQRSHLIEGLYRKLESVKSEHQETLDGGEVFGRTTCKKPSKEFQSPLGDDEKHKVEKLHACSECEMSFSTSSNLKRHQTTHTAERLFECTDCEKNFRHSASLLKHRKMAHKGEAMGM